LATLILSTVGTIVGGPVGSAIGALIGQSIDQQVLAPARRGPRVGDLSVQTSSYGTQIPRIYGTMRVAGSVVWATDLIEHEQTGGGKGGPDVSYSYTVSMAVALSSRRAKSIKRIWADGKLLRGETGDLKVGGALRFYDGGEDQAIDPLIGSIEGITDTPAYRGLALAVFEDLELGEYGNRIPFLTFEIEADEESPTIPSILGDASRDLIACDAIETVVGFAAYGRSIKTAIQPLVDCFGVGLFDDGETLRQPSDGIPELVTADELGCAADNAAMPRSQREQMPARSMPAALLLTYYDAARDFQTGEARADAGELAGLELQNDLPAVLGAADAKALAQRMIAGAWARRDKLTLRLSPSRLALEPGRTLDLPFSPSRWSVEKVTIDGFVVVAELRPLRSGSMAVAADGGRIVANADILAGPISLALLDIPNVLESSEPTVVMAASSPAVGWKRSSVAIDFGGQQLAAHTARTKSTLGKATTALAAGTAEIIDDLNSVDVLLIDTDQWLTSCTDEAMNAGANLAVVGSELIQFGVVTPLGDGKFRLSRLLRGRGGTEWARAAHAANETFCLLQPAALQAIVLPNWSIGAPVTATPTGSAMASIDFAAENLRPPSPVNVSAELRLTGDLFIQWTRRSRQGFAWVDGVDAPLGEALERYRIVIDGSSGEQEFSADQPSLLVPAPTVATFGAGPAIIDVQQIGDFAASRSATITATL
jgi:hypothetical protein